eukprot:Gb_15202 [translate_table: standard]
MLLRSSSTPVLGSQASSGLFLDGVNGGDGEVGVPLFADSAKQFSFPCAQSGFQSISSFASPASQHMTAACDDTCSLDGKSWDFDGEVVPWPNFRRTQSETDLQSLGRSSSAPAKVAAESLLHGTDSSYDDFHVSSSRKQWSRRVMSHKRLQSIPSFSFSGHESEDDEDFEENGSKCNTNMLVGPENNSIDTFKNNLFVSGESNFIDSPNYLKLDDGFIQQEVNFPMDPGLDLVEHQNHRGSQGKELSLGASESLVAKQEVADASKEVRLTHNFKADSEIKSSEFLERGMGEIHSYGSEIGQNGMSLLGLSGVYDGGPPPLFLVRGLGMHVADPPVAMGGGGSGGKSFPKFSTGGDGDGFGADFSSIEEYYQSMLEEDPGNPLLLRNYAQFLYEVSINGNFNFYESSESVNS